MSCIFGKSTLNFCSRMIQRYDWKVENEIFFMVLPIPSIESYFGIFSPPLGLVRIYGAREEILGVKCYQSSESEKILVECIL